LFVQQRYADAEQAYRKTIDLDPAFHLAYYNLGSTLMRQGHFDEAAAWLKKASALLPKDPERGFARQMLQICERYANLDARLPAILRGTEKPQSAAEQIEFANLCRRKKLYAAAARFSAAAFAAEPKLAEDVPKSDRYNAACAAALAGCGRGRDTDTLDDKERTRWRRQARAWLRQDLTWLGMALASGNAQARADVRRRMRLWQSDSDLAGLREARALAAMSADERNECLALWQEVAALLRRAQMTQ
jgi:tetratricopeptide (TPR) repeat protein